MGILIHGGIIVTMDADSRVFSDGAIYIQDDVIDAVGHSSEILQQFSSVASEIIDIHGRILLPGLINTHVHTSQQLARGIADDIDFITWLHERIWPYESQMTEEDSYVSTLLCGIELIHSGVTCFAEAGGQHVSAMAKAVKSLGIRGCLAQSVMDSGQGLPTLWAKSSAESSIQLQLDLYKKFHQSADGRIRIWFGIRQILNATDELLLLTKKFADQLGTGINMHVAEVPYENEHVACSRGANHGTVTHLEKVGLLGENLLAAHSVWVNNEEMDMLSKAGVKISHCPAAAMRMLGFAPIKEMLDKNICVSLGTDGAPSNNRMSIVDEMYVASLINKGREAYIKGSTNPTALPAETILKMATINGAKAVLWDNEIGSLEVGKKADLIVINPYLWCTTPLHDPISSLVYCMRTENVESVMCNGKWIMQNQKILTVNEDQILLKSRVIASELLSRANVKLPKRLSFV
eukprot:TRINITY_DN19212_c0_g1_i1.p1 TRINITY_DN19212_c0_g1~~TRINITY_DN19212_c0_g1_i1.p1  ORF type:complete len:464 (-),score=97.48 TRINITY_DN19212_c0_g1_i1:99-1490(-)